MANSSDWIAAMQQAGEAACESWLTQIPEAGVFVEGSPFARNRAAQPAGEPVSANAPPNGFAHGAANPSASDQVAEPVAGAGADEIDQAFARGEQAGREAAMQEHAEQAERHRALRLSMRQFDSAAIDCLSSELAETVIALCSKVLDDFATDSEALESRCRAAAQRLGQGAAHCVLHLHPADIELLDSAMLGEWQVIGDDSISRGGLRLEGADGCVSDGPVEWRRAIAAAIRG